MTLLAVDKLEVVYQRAITAVQGVSLGVARGKIVALLGTNGAGKTTTLRAISGFLGLDDARVTEGAISFDGERIDNLPPHDITRRGIALVPEREKVFPNLTVAENLLVPVAHAASAADRRRLAEMACQRAAVDRKAPATARTARADQRGVSERHMAVLAGGPPRAGDGFAVDDQRAAEAERDDQVQRRVGSPRGAGPGFGQAGQGGIVAQQQRNVG